MFKEGRKMKLDLRVLSLDTAFCVLFLTAELED
jgi:hypothetical protein